MKWVSRTRRHSAKDPLRRIIRDKLGKPVWKLFGRDSFPILGIKRNLWQGSRCNLKTAVKVSCISRKLTRSAIGPQRRKQVVILWNNCGDVCVNRFTSADGARNVTHDCHYYGWASPILRTSQQRLTSFGCCIELWAHIQDKLPTGVRCCRGERGLPENPWLRYRLELPKKTVQTEGGQLEKLPRMPRLCRLVGRFFRWREV